MAVATFIVYLASVFYMICGANIMVLGQNDPCFLTNICGLNGICQVNISNLVDCSCAPGFYFSNYHNHSQGCLRSQDQPSCSSKSVKKIVMKGIGDTDWPGNDYATTSNMSETACKKSCLDDCSCIVAVFGPPRSDTPFCWKKASPLMYGYTGANRTTFVKVFDTSEPGKEKKGTKVKKRWLVLAGIGFSLLGCLFIVVAFSTRLCLCGSKRNLKDWPEQDRFAGGLKSFKYNDLEKATSHFKEELGRGASGKVYKGTLPDGRVVAVKKLKKIQRENKEVSEKEFRTEMSIIAASHHENLVQLYGFCDEGCNRLLVYEFMSNGSLDKALFEGTRHLDWKRRVEIVLGTARGILYLHHECPTQIIHCDIKPQNILLDENYNPKISDFGIAKLIGADQTRTFTAARGTIGYIAPEWLRSAAITAKVDVYSFGVMTLETICCRKMMDLNKPEIEIILSDWVYDCLNAGILQSLVEEQQSRNQDKIDLEELERMVLVGLWCIQEDPFLRPSIKSVVQMLEGTVEMAVPPCPGTSLERPVFYALQI